MKITIHELTHDMVHNTCYTLEALNNNHVRSDVVQNILLFKIKEYNDFYVIPTHVLSTLVLLLICNQTKCGTGSPVSLASM